MIEFQYVSSTQVLCPGRCDTGCGHFWSSQPFSLVLSSRWPQLLSMFDIVLDFSWKHYQCLIISVQILWRLNFSVFTLRFSYHTMCRRNTEWLWLLWWEVIDMSCTDERIKYQMSGKLIQIYSPTDIFSPVIFLVWITCSVSIYRASDVCITCQLHNNITPWMHGWKMSVLAGLKSMVFCCPLLAETKHDRCLSSADHVWQTLIFINVVLHAATSS